MDPSPIFGSPLLDWLAGLGVPFVGALAAVIRDLYQRINAVKDEAAADLDHAIKKAEAGDRDLWATVDQERGINSRHRETVLEKLGGLPTKQDLTTMEGRIMDALRSRSSQ